MTIMKAPKAQCKVCYKSIYRLPETAGRTGFIYWMGARKAVEKGDPLCLGCKERYH